MTNQRADGDPAGTDPDDSIGYAAALAELDAILRELDGSDVDVDRLADRVQRAAALIATCRERIAGARLRIDAVVADLESAEPGGAGRAEDVDTDPQGTAGPPGTA